MGMWLWLEVYILGFILEIMVKDNTAELLSEGYTVC